MSHKTADIREEFRTNLLDCKNFNEEKLVEEINKTTIKVEQSEFYSTNMKLKIYSYLTMLTNCEEKARWRNYKRLLRLL